ncbi:MAG: T9SS type A sorting domain-containing protein [Flavobacteriales bacterium]
MKFFFFVSCCLQLTLWSQNLLDNGDFESYSTLPSNVMQSNLCVGWSKCNQGGGGSPDYFHTNGTGLVQLPNSFYATIQAHTGNACMGIVAYHGVSTNFREYISHPLSSPLVAGQTYHVSFYVSNGKYNGNYGGCGSDQLGVAFTMNEAQQSGTSPMSNLQAQFVQTGILYDTLWQEIQFTFVADSAYQHLVLGNFQSNGNTLVQNFENSAIETVYYFLDDIVVTRVENSASIVTNTNADAPLFYSVEQQTIAFFQDQQGEQTRLTICDLQGKKVWEQDFTHSESISVQTWNPGLYFYQLTQGVRFVEGGKILIRK